MSARKPITESLGADAVLWNSYVPEYSTVVPQKVEDTKVVTAISRKNAASCRRPAPLMVAESLRDIPRDDIIATAAAGRPATVRPGHSDQAIRHVIRRHSTTRRVAHIINKSREH